MKIEYSSNNSGGDWWLTDQNWFDLEAAGWKVFWVKDDDPKYSSSDRFLGALAKRADKDFPSPKDAIEEFERITGESASDGGCGCCGPPHSFSWTEENGRFGYASGNDVADVLYNVPSGTSYRDLIQQLAEAKQQSKQDGQNPHH